MDEYEKLEKAINEIDKKVDVLHGDHITLVGRVTMIERDINGNGHPGWKDIILDLTAALKEFGDWRKDWETGVSDSERGKTCLWMRSQEAAHDVLADIEEKRERGRKKILICIAILAFILVTIPSSVLVWTNVVKLRNETRMSHLIELLEEKQDDNPTR